MANGFLRVNEAAELALISDSDESLLENESDADERLLGNESDAEDIDESSDTDDAPSTSQAAQSRRGRRRTQVSTQVRTQVRGRSNYVWRPATRQPQCIAFTGNPGPTALAEVSDPENFLEYFQMIINDDVLGIVVEETNRYADQFFSSTAGTLPTHSRAHDWKPLTLPELKIFLGLTLLTRILDKRGHLSDYWSKNPLLYTPFFSQAMSRNRYQNILKFLHFNDNAARPSDSTDKLYKLRPIHDKIVEMWRTLYNPGEQISIDEGMALEKTRECFARSAKFPFAQRLASRCTIHADHFVESLNKNWFMLYVCNFLLEVAVYQFCLLFSSELKQEDLRTRNK